MKRLNARSILVIIAAFAVVTVLLVDVARWIVRAGLLADSGAREQEAARLADYEAAVDGAVTDEEKTRALLALARFLTVTGEPEALTRASGLLRDVIPRASGVMRLRAINDLSAILFQEGDARSACELLGEIEEEVESCAELDGATRARFHFNFGTVLEAVDDDDGALEQYRDSLEADAHFDLASWATFELARSLPAHAPGLERVVEAIDILLDHHNLEMVETGLRTALEHGGWPYGDAVELLEALVRYFAADDVTAERFRATWWDVLETARADMNAEADHGVRLIIASYLDDRDLAATIDLKVGPWRRSEQAARTWATFLKNVGDGFDRAGDVRLARQRYELAHALDPGDPVLGALVAAGDR